MGKKSLHREVRDYVFNKLIFPKVLTIDIPGVIINEVSGILKKKNKKRLIYVFEDVLVDLQRRTAQEFGKDKSSDLWYRVGKDFGTHYAILSKITKQSNKNIELFIGFVCKILNNNGTSIAKNVLFERGCNRITLSGDDNIISRKSGDLALFSGFFSGLFSFILGKNIEARSTSDIKKSSIVLDTLFEEIYVPELNEVVPIKDYNKLNFSFNDIFDKKVLTNKDFIRFNKLYIDDSGKFCFEGKNLVPFDQGIFGFVVSNFLKENQTDFLFESLTEIYFSLAKDLYSEKGIYKNLSFMKSLFSGLGQGVPLISVKGKAVVCKLVFAPIDKNTSEYYARMINGHLNYIFDSNFRFISMKTKMNPFSIEFHYSS